MKLKEAFRGGDTHASPPSRGAWIEIEALNNNTVVMTVAPLAGGVD